MNSLKKHIDDYYSNYTSETINLAKPRHYLEYYNKYFCDILDNNIALLELGIAQGNSQEYFSKIFPKGTIICDRKFSTNRIKIYQGSQDDSRLFHKIMSDNALSQFDIIIDDCAHIGKFALSSFNILYPFLAPGGFYIIEDWGTGYWPRWPGGKSFDMDNHLVSNDREYFSNHQHGLPDVIKQFVDEVAMRNISHNLGLGTNISPKIEYVHIYPGIVFMRKPIMSN